MEEGRKGKQLHFSHKRIGGNACLHSKSQVHRNKKKRVRTSSSLRRSSGFACEKAIPSFRSFFFYNFGSELFCILETLGLLSVCVCVCVWPPCWPPDSSQHLKGDFRVFSPLCVGELPRPSQKSEEGKKAFFSSSLGFMPAREEWAKEKKVLRRGKKGFFHGFEGGEATGLIRKSVPRE